MSKVRDFAEIISAGITASDAGLSNVDNVADADKPISTATTTALGNKADVASPTFTGTPETPILKLTPTATAPAGTKGALYFDSNNNVLMQHDGTEWTLIFTPPQGAGSGGNTTSDYSGYRVHIFTGTGTFTVSGAHSIVNAEILIVGGGGGGRSHVYGLGGAGGGGSVIHKTGHTIPTGSYAMTIGAAVGVDTQGNSTIAFSQTATGGGKGNSGAGGNGGGADYIWSTDASGGTGTAPSVSDGFTAYGGYNGGLSRENGSGGGGGAGEVGITTTDSYPSATPPDGGAGKQISGMSDDGGSFYWGGGGGGCSHCCTLETGRGGIGGGGAGGYDNNRASASGGVGWNAGGSSNGHHGGDGGANTGGGGGGGGYDGAGVGGGGGSGMVIIKYTL